MDKSESISNLAVALAKFQGDIRNPSNTATNPFFKSKYAPLSDVLNLVRPILSENGLSVIQAPSSDGENVIVTTTLLHNSGEFIEFPPLVLKADKPTAQGAGSAITYARRYAISAILGISSEDDDDGNEGDPKPEPKPPKSKQGKPIQQSKLEEKENKKALEDASYASDKLLEVMYKLVKEKNFGNESMKAYIKNAYGKDSSKALTEKEASEIIVMLQEMGQ